MGLCRNSSCGDSRRAQKIKLSELKASVANGQSHLEPCGSDGVWIMHRPRIRASRIHSSPVNLSNVVERRRWLLLLQQFASWFCSRPC